jgi:Spy/CpxP family protein refolding chaperone
MNKNQFAKRVAVAAGFFLLGAAPGLTRAQSSPPPVLAPHAAPPLARHKKATPPTDDFAGLTFTDDQKAKIDEIHQNYKSRKNAVNKDAQLSQDQKVAMLQGFERMELGEVFRVLTPEQQLEVRKRVATRRAAEKKEKKLPVPVPVPK